jgi:GNAT superfamily N-acetyltransferase
MPFLRVDPDDSTRVTQAVDLLNAANALDDPGSVPSVPALTAGYLRYGHDLDPVEMQLYLPDEDSAPVGVLEIEFPRRDNRHLGWAAITVHPAHRRQGHGTAMLQEVVRRTEAAGRTTIWLGAPEDDQGARAFVEQLGFQFASHDARRRQVLAEVDPDEVERRRREAERAAAGYVLERGTAPTPDAVLEQLVEVTAAINDAPMGELTFEDEVFDLPRLRDIETAAVSRGFTVYRLWARQRSTGQVGGHTVVLVNPLQPHNGWQGDTAVSRNHRGHRLGLLLKAEMMRWLAEVEPQLEVVETWNHVDNRFMIDVNEALGYRLSRVFAMYERRLDRRAPGLEDVAAEVTDEIPGGAQRQLSEAAR